MYCRRCDKEDVGNFHRCFWYGFKPVRPLKKKPTKNTKLARKIAEFYEEYYQEPFPGGISNARIYRDYTASRAYKDTGAWTWSLWTIDRQGCRDFGSEYTATECGKNKKLLQERPEEFCFDT